MSEAERKIIDLLEDILHELTALRSDMATLNDVLDSIDCGQTEMMAQLGCEIK